jgi:hypothetical protein
VRQYMRQWWLCLWWPLSVPLWIVVLLTLPLATGWGCLAEWRGGSSAWWLLWPGILTVVGAATGVAWPWVIAAENRADKLRQLRREREDRRRKQQPPIEPVERELSL